MENEVAQHVLVCDKVDMQQEFGEAVEVLERGSTEQDTFLGLVDCIVNGVSAHSIIGWTNWGGPQLIENNKLEDGLQFGCPMNETLWLKDIQLAREAEQMQQETVCDCLCTKHDRLAHRRCK